MAQPSVCPECGAMMFVSWPKGEMFPALVTHSYGATCGTCGFRYAEHEGHIIPCPRCAAVDLERRVGEAEVAHQIADSFWAALKPLNLPAINVENPGVHVTELVARLARLEEEKAQAERDVSSLHETNQHLESNIREGDCQIEILVARLAQAEAREAAMHRVVASRITLWRSHGDAKVASPYSHLTVVGELEVIARELAALSPAGRALAAEVEKFREVARLSRIVEQYGCEVGSQTWSELRDVLAAMEATKDAAPSP